VVLGEDVLRAEVPTPTRQPVVQHARPDCRDRAGLLLISAVSDRWGVEPSRSGKVVWFELLAGRDAQHVLDVDALLASWGDELAVDPADECVRVVLTDLDVGLAARAEAHVEALVRELTLVLASGTAPPDDRRPAGNVVSAAAAVDPVRADLRHQVAVALARGRDSVDVELTVRRRDAEAVRDLLHALDEADRLSRTGGCCSPGAGGAVGRPPRLPAPDPRAARQLTGRERRGRGSRAGGPARRLRRRRRRCPARGRRACCCRRSPGTWGWSVAGRQRVGRLRPGGAARVLARRPSERVRLLVGTGPARRADDLLRLVVEAVLLAEAARCRSGVRRSSPSARCWRRPGSGAAAAAPVSWLAWRSAPGPARAARHLLDRAVTRGPLPDGILVVNLLGSLLAGVVAGAAPGPGDRPARRRAAGGLHHRLDARRRRAAAAPRRHRAPGAARRRRCPSGPGSSSRGAGSGARPGPLALVRRAPGRTTSGTRAARPARRPPVMVRVTSMRSRRRPAGAAGPGGRHDPAPPLSP
jgi:hypothetical protein